MQIKNSPQVLIVILNYYNYEYTLNLINDIHNHLLYDNYKILVIDNSSPNDSAVILNKEKNNYGYFFYANQNNTGYAAGNNIGIRYAIENDYKYSWILNNDVTLRESNLLSHMISIMESDDSIGCIGPKIICKDGSVCAPYCNRPNLLKMSVGYIFDRIHCKKYSNISREVYRVYGCCMLLRSSAMEKIDCMDERTFLYNEEEILSERLISCDYKTFYDSDVSVIHEGSASVKSSSINKKIQTIKNTQKSRELYLKEYRHFSSISIGICNICRNIIQFIRS